MNQFYARKIADVSDAEERFQLLSDHLMGVANLTSRALKQLGEDLARLGYKIGLCHDLGKGREEWQRYLKSGDRSKCVSHSLHGGIKVYQEFRSNTKFRRVPSWLASSKGGARGLK